MVSLSKHQAVDPLHSRFRTAQQAPAQTSSESASGQNEFSDPEQEDVVLDTRVEEVVRYVSPTPRETRSQQDRLAKANAGDLRARLDLITLESAEEALDRRRYKYQPERSILSYLQDPGDGLAKYQAASSILEQLADETENAGFDSALVFRYIDSHGLWRDHPSSEVRSAEDLVRQLGNSDLVQANIVIGTSTQSAKRNCARMIAASWGPDWFQKIPTTIKDPLWSRAEECSKRTLTQIAANVKHGVTLEKAVESWTQAIEKRNDPAVRRINRSRSRVTPHLMPDDIAILNLAAEDQGADGRAPEPLQPIETREDTLRVEVIAPSTPKPPPSRPDYSIGSQPRKTRKRRRLRGKKGDETRSQDEERTEGGWVKISKRSMVKRVRNHRIRKAVTEADRVESESNCHDTPLRKLDDRLTPPSAQPPSAQVVNIASEHRSRRHPTCDGPAVALMFRKFIELCNEIPSLDNDGASERKCCDACRPLVIQDFSRLRSELENWAAELERVESHTSDGEVIDPSQEHDISSLRQAQTRKSPVNIHDSDSDEPGI